MPLCCETSLVANNHWDQLFIEQVLQLTSLHRWTQFALLAYQITLVALCQHWMWHKGSTLFSPHVNAAFVKPYVPQFCSALHVVIVEWELDFLPSMHFWGLYHQRNCSPTSRLQRGDVGLICTAHQENRCTFFWAFSLPTGINEFFPCMFPGHHWLDLCSCTLHHAGWRIENCFGGWCRAGVAF